MEYHKLGNLVTIQKGRKNNIEPSYNEASKRIIQIQDLRNDEKIIYTNDEKGLLVNENDILIAWDGANAGLVGYGKSGFLGSTLSMLRLKSKSIYSTYLGRFLNTKFDYFQKTATGATIPHLNRLAIEELLIPLPSYVDQIRIANVLGKIEEVIQTRKNAIDQLDELVKATFHDMFGDPFKIKKKYLKTIDDVSLQVTDGEHSTPIRTDTGIKLLSARNIQNGYLDFRKGVDYVGEEEYKRIIKRCKPELQDILMSCSGSIGRVCVINIDEPLTLVRSVALIKLKKEELNSIYFMHWLQTDFLQFEIQKKSKKSSQANIFTGAIKELPVFIPDFTKQNQFASIAQKIEELKVEQEKQLKEMEILYASVSHAAFSGTLDLTRIPFDESLLPTTAAEKKPKKDDEIKLKEDVEIKPKEDVEKEEVKEYIDEIENNTPLQLNDLKDNKTKDVLLSSKEWSKLSFKKIAELIKAHYQSHYFNSEMLLRFLSEDLQIIVDYFSSKEQKINLKLENANDFLVFLADAVIDKNPYLRLEQVFYNAEEENIRGITFTSQDLEALRKKTKQKRSGIYFRIKNETTTR